MPLYISIIFPHSLQNVEVVRPRSHKHSSYSRSLKLGTYLVALLCTDSLSSMSCFFVGNQIAFDVSRCGRTQAFVVKCEGFPAQVAKCSAVFSHGGVGFVDDLVFEGEFVVHIHTGVGLCISRLPLVVVLLLQCCVFLSFVETIAWIFLFIA